MIRVSAPMFVLLLFVLQAVAVLMANSEDRSLKKRRMCIFPQILMENRDYTNLDYIDKVYSEYENVTYSLTGVGADKYPFNVFVSDPHTGDIRLTQVLDREFIPYYYLTLVIKFANGTIAEERDWYRYRIADENDNAPVFGQIKPGEVDELSPEGSFVMKVTATDADEPWSLRSVISYTIINQNPPDDMFYINRDDGSIFVKKPLLEREKCGQYILTVRGQDLKGLPEGNTGTGNVTINIRDVNNNLPTLEKEQYEGSIEGNIQGVEVMRIQAEDLDLKATDNWKAVFNIVRGNEGGYFSIKTDPNTNKGILMLDKPVDYENVKNFVLGLTVRNKAPPFSGGSFWQWGGEYKIYPIKINVKNQPEGPHFDPKVKAIAISKKDTSFNITDVVASNPAIDQDTGELAENVRYAKGSDPDNWLTIDPETAEIKLNRIPDRESPYLVNGTYFAKVLCITKETPAKTATGTIAIQLENFNDHCPIVTSDIKTMCTTENSVIVNANNEDAYPNGPPFKFEIIPENTKGKWHMENLNDTAAILRVQNFMWPGIYEVELVIKDQQGKACPEPQRVWVRVCTCEDGVVCGKWDGNNQPVKRVQLGPASIGIMVVLPLLCFFLFLIFCHYKKALRDLSPANMVRFKDPSATAPEYTTLAVATESLNSGTVLHSGEWQRLN
ncbi:desmoglein-2.1 isoform X1 [Maylandia zebra]|uniref:desmoglein-2.1 isoform X1 n=1 Tax=Maylandia zebra TaxID=106582 RepID=UPI00403CE3E0